MPTMKFRELSLSGMTAKSATFFSPSEARSSSSICEIAAICGRLYFSSRTPSETSMLFAVLPAANLKIEYCFTARLSGSSIARRLNISSRMLVNSSSSSCTSAALSKSITMGKFCSSGGAMYSRYRINASRSAVSDFSQNGSLFDAPLGVVLRIKLVTSFNTSFSSRRYANGL